MSDITASVNLPSVIVPNVVAPVSRIIPDLGVYHNQHLSFLFLFKLVKQDDLLNIKAHTVNSFVPFHKKTFGQQTFGQQTFGQ
jgi:hypothetical protein